MADIFFGSVYTFDDKVLPSVNHSPKALIFSTNTLCNLYDILFGPIYIVDEIVVRWYNEYCAATKRMDSSLLQFSKMTKISKRRLL